MVFMNWEYNEELLIKRAKKGNNEALSHLIQHHYNFIMNYITKISLDRNLAEDLTQDTCYKIIKKFNTYNETKASLSTWMIQVAINTYKDYCRKEKTKLSFLDLLKKEASEESSPVFGMGNSATEMPSEGIIDLKEALARIGPDHRIPLVLKYYYGYEQSEIASLMGIPIGTVKSRLSNGLKYVRKELRNE